MSNAMPKAFQHFLEETNSMQQAYRKGLSDCYAVGVLVDTLVELGLDVDFQKMKPALRKHNRNRCAELIQEGIKLHAWWKDGIQYVGTTGLTLKQALAEVAKETK